VYRWPIGPPGTTRHGPGNNMARYYRARHTTIVLLGRAVPVHELDHLPKHGTKARFVLCRPGLAREFHCACRSPVAAARINAPAIRRLLDSMKTTVGLPTAGEKNKGRQVVRVLRIR
jgi:hypothetical protein